MDAGLLAAREPFRHYLLTRFNVRIPTYEHPADHDWLARRVELFQTFCLPSVAGQTCQAFDWILFLDSETPSAVRQTIETLSNGSYQTVYVDGAFSAEVVGEHIAAETDAAYVITTRLDNDDAVAADFIETIQSCFAYQDFEFINLVTGSQLREGRVYRRPYTKNPFVSLIESRTGTRPRTVFATRHFAVDRVGSVRNIRSPHPMWLQVIHGDNVLNEVVGLRVRGETLAPFFGCVIRTSDDTSEYLVDRALGVLRILWRLLSRPRRVVELGRAAFARFAGP